MAYREGESDPDASERESDAIERYGQWSLQLKTRVFVAAVPVVLGAMGLSVWVIMATLDVVPRIVVVGVPTIIGGLLLWGARGLGRMLVRAGTQKKLAELSAGSGVPVARLAETTDLANQL